MKSQKDKLYFPSDYIGIEEEYLPSDGTHIEKHKIISSVFGKVFIDKEKYRASVIPFQKRKLSFSRYDTVIGEVIRVSKTGIKISLHYLNKKPISPSASATMHISDVSKEYVSNIDEVYAAGDIIRATIIDAKSYPVQLETTSNNNGVIFTLCELCGENVKKIRRDLLQCESCEHMQKRLTSIDYGEFKLLAEY